MLFPSQPNALLLLADDGETALPPLVAPFVRREVLGAFADLDAWSAPGCESPGYAIRVTEGAAGRWAQALRTLESNARAERANQQRERDVVRAVVMKTAVDDVERERSALIVEKHAVDAEIRSLKQQIGEAKARAWSRGLYLPPAEYRELEARMRRAQDRSIAMQNTLGELRRQQKDENRQDHDGWTERFIQAARERLEPELFRELEATAHKLTETADLEAEDAR